MKVMKNITTWDNTTNWEKTGNRFVAFLDILGFKELVSIESHNEVYDILVRLSDLTKGLQLPVKLEDGDGEIIFITQFSDSIIIFTKDDSPLCFSYLSLVLVHLLHQTINMRIAIKGACAHGKITIDRNRSLFFGQALIDAYLLEEDVFYYGIVCHHSFEKYINSENFRRYYDEIIKKDFDVLETLFFSSKTKLKSVDIIHTNVNWFWKYFQAEGTGEETYQRISISLKKIQEQVSGKPRIYIDNTMEMAKRLLNIT